jgi:hypothetical protein
MFITVGLDIQIRWDAVQVFVAGFPDEPGP